MQKFLTFSLRDSFTNRNQEFEWFLCRRDKTDLCVLFVIIKTQQSIFWTKKFSAKIRYSQEHCFDERNADFPRKKFCNVSFFFTKVKMFFYQKKKRGTRLSISLQFESQRASYLLDKADASLELRGGCSPGCTIRRPLAERPVHITYVYVRVSLPCRWRDRSGEHRGTPREQIKRSGIPEKSNS